jgi:hypothetical protein
LIFQHLARTTFRELPPARKSGVFFGNLLCFVTYPAFVMSCPGMSHFGKIAHCFYGNGEPVQN